MSGEYEVNYRIETDFKSNFNPERKLTKLKRIETKNKNNIVFEPECGFREAFRLTRTGVNERMNCYTGERVTLTKDAIILHDIIKLSELSGFDYSEYMVMFRERYPEEYMKLLD